MIYLPKGTICMPKSINFFVFRLAAKKIVFGRWKTLILRFAKLSKVRKGNIPTTLSGFHGENYF